MARGGHLHRRLQTFSELTSLRYY